MNDLAYESASRLAGRLRDQDADIAILVAFGPRAATGAKARPDHCRKLMAAFRAQHEAAPTEKRVTVVDALGGDYYAKHYKQLSADAIARVDFRAVRFPGLISAVTEESSGRSPVTMSPENSVNRPRTLLTIMWRTEKPTSECTGSMLHLPAT